MVVGSGFDLGLIVFSGFDLGMISYTFFIFASMLLLCFASWNAVNLCIKE